MAQTDSVPSSSRQLITGESANQSTTRRALKLPAVTVKPSDRRYFIGGSDARIIMGNDEAALLRLWREKRGEIEPEDLSGNLVVQLGVTTEGLNRRWYQANTGQILTDVQRQIRHPVLRWMAAALDGRVEATGAQRAIAVSRAFWSGDVHGVGTAMVESHPPAMMLLGLPWGPLASWDAAGNCFITLWQRHARQTR